MRCFGEENFCKFDLVQEECFDASAILSNVFDHILWYSKSRDIKIRRVYGKRTFENSDSRFFDSIQLPDGTRRQLTKDEKERAVQLPDGSAVFARNPLTSAGLSSTSSGSFHFQGTDIPCASNSHWKTTPEGMTRLAKADRFAMKGTRLRMVASSPTTRLFRWQTSGRTLELADSLGTTKYTWSKPIVVQSHVASS